MKEKSFIEILGDRIRADLRAEIESEVKSRVQSAQSVQSQDASEASGFSRGLAPEPWLLTRLQKTLFPQAKAARQTYARFGGSAGASAHPQAQGPQSRRSSQFNTEDRTEVSSQTNTKDHTTTHTKANSPAQDKRPTFEAIEKDTASMEFRFTATSLEELCAVEILRRHGDDRFSVSFTENDLKNVWRKAALKTHPDLAPNKDAITQARMTALFREISDAHELLACNFEANKQKAA